VINTVLQDGRHVGVTVVCIAVEQWISVSNITHCTVIMVYSRTSFWNLHLWEVKQNWKQLVLGFYTGTSGHRRFYHGDL
jgi:hypothetical protein